MTDTPATTERLAAEWSVGIVAQTVEGEHLLKMTEAQAIELRDSLQWLLSDDEDGAR